MACGSGCGVLQFDEEVKGGGVVETLTVGAGLGESVVGTGVADMGGELVVGCGDEK